MLSSFITSYTKSKNNYIKLDIQEPGEFSPSIVYEGDPEEKERVHPLSKYHFEIDDLSLNLNCKLKWLKYAIKAFKIIKELLNDEEHKTCYLNFNTCFKQNETIQCLAILKDLKEEKQIIQLFIYDSIVIIDDDFNVDKFVENLNDINYKCYLTLDDNSINSYIYSIEDIIKLKLKLNLFEFIFLTSEEFSLDFSRTGETIFFK